MNRRDILTTLGIATFGASLCNAAETEKGRGLPATTAEDLAAAVRKEGFQWKFVGRNITFTGVVVDEGTVPRVRIDGMEKDNLDSAAIHNAPANKSLATEDKVELHGLIVDQWYGVWQVWCYELTLAKV